MKKPSNTTKAIAAGSLLLAGLGAGVVIGATGSASAESDSPSSSSSAAPDGTPGFDDHDPSQSMRPDEKPLTGTTASKVRAAALAKYPGATIERVETDSEGVYEAHIVTSAGEEVTVQVGKDFTVTGTQVGGHGGRHGDDGPGDRHGDGPDDDPSGDTSGSSTSSDSA